MRGTRRRSGATHPCTELFLPPVPIAPLPASTDDPRTLPAGADRPSGPPLASDDRRADQGATGTRTADDRDRSSSDDAAESEAPQPRRLRVQGPNKVALQHFLTIQNSGCFSAG